MAKTIRRMVLSDALNRKAGGHGKSKKAKRMADKRELRDLGAWGIQR